ncbi:hypothetical protein MP638_002962 [Amoeboaphelidium occidentale]|nr:hypothetical protein MP638_002962 [Amoeboaphelidium occidentale]
MVWIGKEADMPVSSGFREDSTQPHPSKLAEVVQEYKEHQNMLEPFLGRVDLSDGEKEAIARIETLMAQLAQRETYLRKEQLALIQKGQIQKKKQKRIQKESVDARGLLSFLIIGSSSSLYKSSRAPSSQKKLE